VSDGGVQLSDVSDAPRSGALSSAAGSLRDVLRNRGIRRLEIAWALGIAADWAFLVVLLIVVYNAGGALATGILGAVRCAPAIFAAPFATSLLERARGDRVLSAINLIRAGAALATAVVVGLDLPVETVYVLAAVVAAAGALVRPILLALMPALARTPTELVAANVTFSTGEGIGTFVGPVVAGVLVAVTGSATASLLVAAVFATAAAAVTSIDFEHSADARTGSASGSERFRIRDAPRTLRRYRPVSVVLADFTAQTFVRGLLLTFVVVASIELLGMGDSGVGLLNGAIGLGGLVGSLGALALRGGSQLTKVFVLALAGWGSPLLLIAGWPTPALALLAFFIVGVNNALLDVSGFTLVQRGVTNEDRVAVFGVMESIFAIGLLCGSLLAPALLSFFGTRGALAFAGMLLPLLALATWRPIAIGFRRAIGREDRVTRLRRDPLFAPLPLTALDRLAERARPSSFEAGEVLMHEGEPGDDYLVIVSGVVEVTERERLVRTCGPGEGIGEIALVRRIPRTATVRAREHVDVLAVDGATFLSAIAGPAATAAADAQVAARSAASVTP
jgi:cyclic nucleotide-binding protein/MFS transporter